MGRRLCRLAAGGKCHERYLAAGAPEPRFIAVAAAVVRFHAALGPNDKFDLVIQKGDGSLRAIVGGKRDIGSRYGLIEAVEAESPATKAPAGYSMRAAARTPVSVDLHCTVFPYGSAAGIPADELMFPTNCTTTCVRRDAAPTTSAFRRRPSGADAHPPLRPSLHIANLGFGLP